MSTISCLVRRVGYTTNVLEQWPSKPSESVEQPLSDCSAAWWLLSDRSVVAWLLDGRSADLHHQKRENTPIPYMHREDKLIDLSEYSYPYIH